MHSPRAKINLLAESHPREKAWGEHIPLLAAVVGMLSEGLWWCWWFLFNAEVNALLLFLLQSC